MMHRKFPPLLVFTLPVVGLLAISCVEVSTEDELVERMAIGEEPPVFNDECETDEDCADCEYCDYDGPLPELKCIPQTRGCDGEKVCGPDGVVETCADGKECCSDGAGGFGCVDDCEYCSGHTFYYNGGAGSNDCCANYGKTCQETEHAIGCLGSCTSNCDVANEAELQASHSEEPIGTICEVSVVADEPLEP